MKKNKIIAILSVCAVAFCALACFLIYQYMSPARDTIYVFNDSYSIGEQVTEDMLSPVQVDSTITVAGKKSGIETRFVTPAEYAAVLTSGDSLRMDVSEGMPLTTSMLSTTGGSTVEMNMQSDLIAVTVAVDPITGISNDLKEGSRVNVYASIDAETELLQQNKRVLEVFYEEGEITGVSIEENASESMELIYAATYGKIYLGLVDGTGYQAVEDGMVYSPYTQALNTISDDAAETEAPDETEASDETEAPAETETAQEETGGDTVFTPES